MSDAASGTGLTRSLGRRWLVVLLGVLVGLVVAVVALEVLPERYSATATLFVKGVPGTGAGANLQAAQHAVSRARSYPAFINSTPVIEGVRADIGPNVSAEDLRRDLSAANPPDTPLVNVSASAGSPEEAQKTADSAARHLALFITQIETVSGVSPVIVETAVQADLPTRPTSPSRVLVLGLGLSGGLAAGVCGAVIIDQVRIMRVNRRAHGARRQEDA